MSYIPTALGTYNTTPPTLTNGQTSPLQVDSNANLLINFPRTFAGEDINNNLLVTELRYNYVNINTATTTVIKTQTGLIHSLVINTPVASAVIKLYDNTSGSGTLMATITYPATLLSSGPVSIVYDDLFFTGLTIVTTGTPDLTVSYR